MTRVDVWIHGTSPLLQNRFPDPEVDGIEIDESSEMSAWRRAHIDDEGFLCMPGAAVWHLLGQVARDRGTAFPKHAVVVLDDMIPLYTCDGLARLEDVAIDARPVKSPHGNRVMRYRPRVDEWGAPLRLHLNEWLISPTLVRDLLVEGGESVGLGDFRPQCGGPFGMFVVTGWAPPHHDASPGLHSRVREMAG